MLRVSQQIGEQLLAERELLLRLDQALFQRGARLFSVFIGELPLPAGNMVLVVGDKRTYVFGRAELHCPVGFRLLPLVAMTWWRAAMAMVMSSRKPTKVVKVAGSTMANLP